MDVTAYITQVLGHEFNIPALDADNTDRRTRTLEFLTQLVERVWYAKAWPWRRSISSVSVLVNTYASNLPADFQSIGDRRYGGVWLSGEPLTGIPEWQMREIQESTDGGSTSTPEVYSIYGQDPTLYRYQIQVPKAAAGYTLRVAYESLPPTLDESGNVANLQKIPAQYHQSCLIPPGRAWARRTFGAQDVDVDAEIEAAIRRIARAERAGAEAPVQMPAFNMGEWS